MKTMTMTFLCSCGTRMLGDRPRIVFRSVQFAANRLPEFKMAVLVIAAKRSVFTELQTKPAALTNATILRVRTVAEIS